MTERFGRADERRKDDETRLKEKQKQWQNSKLYQREVQKSDQGELDNDVLVDLPVGSQVKVKKAKPARSIKNSTDVDKLTSKSNRRSSPSTSTPSTSKVYDSYKQRFAGW